MTTADGAVDIAESSTRLCSQAVLLRANLRETIDNGDLSAALEIAEQIIGNDCIVALLAMVQCVKRDVGNDFRPIFDAHDAAVAADDDATHQLLALNNMADLALLTLSDLYTVGELFLKPPNRSNVSGGIVYEHNETGELSEEPNYEKLSWQMKLMLSIPILIEPGCVNGEVVWAATVVYYQHGSTMDEQFDLESSDSSSSCVSVIDILKSEEDGQSARLRGTYHGCWRGLYAEAVGEMDMANSIGQVLESWTETTLAGLSVTNNQSSSNARILVIGLGCGQLVSFLRHHVSDVELHVIEGSQTMIDIALKYYQLPPCLLDCVSIVDPTEYVKSQRLEGQEEVGEFDTIIINVCSIDDTFPDLLMNEEFFHGLMSMLSNHPTATLLVNSGVNVEAVSLLVESACKHIHGHRSGHMLILREHLLRDHTVSDDEGVIVAAQRREWSLSAEDWQREHMGEDAQSSGSMDVATAQRTQVVRLEKFLSLEDIEMIHAVANAELASIGEATNGALEAHTDSWKVLYLQHRNTFQRKLPALRKRILDMVRQVDKSQNWCLFDNVDHVNIRVVEYHQMDEFGELSDPKHYDLNSLLTIDIMLSDDDAFEGGDLQTQEADGTLKKHEFKQGDALVFVSHKYHCVDRVRSGRRNVMVLEFWYGPERQCSHRCERFGREICTRDPAQNVYTQQYPLPKQSDHLKEGSASSIPLPFRLGSVTTCKEDSRETLELLWEPCGSTEVVKDKSASVHNEEQLKDKALSDAFACFGDSDSDDDSS
ncbi:LOW QUALITY PROTEIN: hypothetical protein ACHAXR_010094 [Thalassiosira sp. AJA248-18]